MNDLDASWGKPGKRNTALRSVTAAMLVAWIAIASPCFSEGDNPPWTTVPLGQPLGDQGTISFQMEATRGFHNGPKAESADVGILEIPEVAALSFSQDSSACELRWIWADGIKAEPLVAEIPELPGPESYFVEFTWDAGAGRFNGYVNGTPIRLPGTPLPPWTVPRGVEVRLAAGPIKPSLLQIAPGYSSEAESASRVPEKMRGRHADLFGVQKGTVAPIQTDARLGGLLYEAAMGTPHSIDGWVMEGPGRAIPKDQGMLMTADRPEGKAKNGHFVFWCPQDFPDSFVADWEVEILSEQGLCIVFFAARGSEGEDLFAPELSRRNGIFTQYTRGDISCYHISYYANTPSAPGRATSNMRKNSGFHLVANGPPGIQPRSAAVHPVRLIKDGDHSQLLVDGAVVIDFTDDGGSYGPALAGGRIGFRQMQWTVARYRNFRVHALEPAGGNTSPRHDPASGK